MAFDERVDGPFPEARSVEYDEDELMRASLVPFEDSEFSLGVTDAMRRARGIQTTDAHTRRLSDAEFARRYPRADLAITMAAIYRSREAISLD